MKFGVWFSYESKYEVVIIWIQEQGQGNIGSIYFE